MKDALRQKNVQIAAQTNDKIFNIHVLPYCSIISSTCKVTSIYKDSNTLYLNSIEVIWFDTATALEAFKDFLENVSSKKKCLLVTHNANIDKRILLNHIISNNMQEDLK